MIERAYDHFQPANANEEYERMSDQNMNTEKSPTTTDAKPAKKRTQAKSYTVGQLAVIRAKDRKTDSSRAAKEIRGRLRANFDEVVKLQPSIKKSKSSANDGNRWPALNASVVKALKLANIK